MDFLWYTRQYKDSIEDSVTTSLYLHISSHLNIFLDRILGFKEDRLLAKLVT